MKNTKNGFVGLPVLIFSFITLVGVSALMYVNYNKSKTFITQEQNSVATTTDETSGWKTYKNEKYGFELKYPSSLSVDISSDEEIYLGNKNSEVGQLIRIRITSNKTGLSVGPESIVKFDSIKNELMLIDSVRAKSDIIRIKPISIVNNWYEFTPFDNSEGLSDEIYTYHDGFVFQINLFPDLGFKGNNLDYIKIKKQFSSEILKSLVFVR